MAGTNQPPPVPPSWRSALRWRQAGRWADGIARSIFESMANKIWTGQDEIDPPGLRRDVESASERGGLYTVLNMLADAKVITYRRGYAPIRGFATEYMWFRLTWWGKFFSRWPVSPRQTFLGLVWLARRYGRLVRQVSSFASIVIAVIKSWNGAWADVVLALAVFVALVAGLGRPAISRNVVDT
jgi:hypothetical protein